MTATRAAVLLACSAAALASRDVYGTVYGAESRPEANVLVLLDGGERSARSRLHGAFAFYNVSAGVHLVEVQPAGTLVYPTFKLQVPGDRDSGAADDDAAAAVDGDGAAGAAGGVRAVEYRYPGAAKIAAPFPLVIRPVASALYYDERPQGSFLSMLLTPSTLLMLSVAACAFCMPKGMLNPQNLDPEQREQMQQQQAAMADPMAAISAMFSGGGAAAPAPAPAAAGRPAAIGGGGGGAGAAAKRVGLTMRKKDTQ